MFTRLLHYQNTLVIVKHHLLKLIFFIIPHCLVFNIVIVVKKYLANLNLELEYFGFSYFISFNHFVIKWLFDLMFIIIIAIKFLILVFDLLITIIISNNNSIQHFSKLSSMPMAMAN